MSPDDYARDAFGHPPGWWLFFTERGESYPVAYFVADSPDDEPERGTPETRIVPVIPPSAVPPTWQPDAQARTGWEAVQQYYSDNLAGDGNEP